MMLPYIEVCWEGGRPTTRGQVIKKQLERVGRGTEDISLKRGKKEPQKGITMYETFCVQVEDSISIVEFI